MAPKVSSSHRSVNFIAKYRRHHPDSFCSSIRDIKTQRAGYGESDARLFHRKKTVSLVRKILKRWPIPAAFGELEIFSVEK
jgi:hypothetical protein